jgi:2-methylcitrate dehydratase PrpD
LEYWVKDPILQNSVAPTLRFYFEAFITPDLTISETIASRLAALRLERIPATVVAAAKLHILDSLGCLLAGSRLEPGKLAYELAVAASGVNVESTLFGTVRRASYCDAVQAMSAAAHCGEMDDIHGGAGTCVGGMVVPALLAMAEKYGGTGRRLIEAVIAGYETTVRVGLAIDAPKLFERGWWPSTVCGGVGVAAAGAIFFDWPVEKTVNATGIACLHAGGMLTGGNEGATARHLAFGRAAQSGIAALLAADVGLTGPRRAFEDPRGFCLTLCQAPRWSYLRDMDRCYLPEVAFKPYPCARQLHAGVEALLAIMEQYPVISREVEAIELSVPTQNAGMVNRPAMPTSHAASVGSGQYVMAVTALRGKIDLASFGSEYLESDAVRRLMTKVIVTGSAELDSHFPKYWPGRVIVRLRGGQTRSEQIIVPKGESGNPMTQREVEEKFLGLAEPVLGEAKARLVMEEISLLESRDSLAPLLAAIQRSE